MLSAMLLTLASTFAATSPETPKNPLQPLDFLVGERSVCVNTTAAGGNASLMSIG